MVQRIKKNILYFHGGSCNHGCEAIVRSTSGLIGGEIHLFSHHKEEDEKYFLNKICKVHDFTEPLKKNSKSYWQAFLRYHLLSDKLAFDEAMFQPLYRELHDADMLFSIGGDNYCYEYPLYYIALNRRLKKLAKKIILWGASVDINNIQTSAFRDLETYSTIIARESITATSLINKGFKNVHLFPDPAFSLKRTDLPLSSGFKEGNTIGINVSPLIMNYESSKGITWRNYRALIQYIIESTDMQIALIPHVVWEASDDRLPLRMLYDEFKETNRIVLIDDHNCEELKGYIARCRFMIAARTHASIAAYSSQVPTLVVGYSVKAKGIAKDIFGTDENYVLPVHSLKDEHVLTKGFQFLLCHEDEIRRYFRDFMPEYIHRLDNIKDVL